MKIIESYLPISDEDMSHIYYQPVLERKKNGRGFYWLNWSTYYLKFPVGCKDRGDLYSHIHAYTLARIV